MHIIAKVCKSRQKSIRLIIESAKQQLLKSVSFKMVENRSIDTAKFQPSKIKLRISLQNVIKYELYFTEHILEYHDN